MNNTDFLTAAQAKQLTEEASRLDEQYKRKETLETLEMIKQVSTRGQSSITTHNYTDNIIINRLKNIIKCKNDIIEAQDIIIGQLRQHTTELRTAIENFAGKFKS